MRLREATAADAPAIAALHTESWRRAYRGSFSDAYLDGPVFEDRREVWRQRYEAPNPAMFTLLAEDEHGGLMGFACSFGGEDPTWGTLLDNLHVTGDAEGHGIGRRLLAASALWSERAYPGLGFYLWVLQDNARARRFYEHLGAVDAGTERIEMPGGVVTSHRYVWHSINSLRPYGPRPEEWVE